MSDPSDSYTQHAALFTRVYDLDDPSPYFSTLRPTGYRMPVALAGALEAIHAPLGAVRGAGHSLRLLDFACGYGAIGALLRHDVSMAEIYARYGERQWQPEDGRRYWEADAAFFAARRAERAAFEIAGIDIAGNALDYASALGFVDRAFHENLVDDAPSDGLKRFLHGVDLVVESGALGVMLPVAFERVFDCVGDESAALVSLQPSSRCELDGAEQVVGRTGVSHGKLLLPAGPLPQATGRAGAGGHASPLPRVRQAGRGHHARRLLSGRPDAGETRGRCREPTDRAVAGTLGLRGFRASVLSLKFA